MHPSVCIMECSFAPLFPARFWCVGCRSRQRISGISFATRPKHLGGRELGRKPSHMDGYLSCRTDFNLVECNIRTQHMHRFCRPSGSATLSSPALTVIVAEACASKRMSWEKFATPLRKVYPVQGIGGKRPQTKGIFRSSCESSCIRLAFSRA